MSRVSFDLPRQIGRKLPLPDLSRKIEGDTARRVHPGMRNDHLATLYSSQEGSCVLRHL